MLRIALLARPGGLNDEQLDVLDALDRLLFPHDDLSAKLNSYWWLAYSGDQVVGFASLDIQAGSRAVLGRAGVLKEFRGQGLHRRLIRVRLTMARKLGLAAAYVFVAPHCLVSGNNLISCGFRLYRPRKPWGLPKGIYFKQQLKKSHTVRKLHESE